jgi:WD40 repeat protein
VSSLSSGIALLSESTDSQILSHLQSPTGTTQVMFSPKDPNTLFSAARRSDSILVWDVRNTTHPIRSYERPGQTNQRLWFDIDPSGRWLASGDQNGCISLWDLSERSVEPTYTVGGAGGTVHFLHTLSSQLDCVIDAVGSVHFHPKESLVLSATGSRTCSLSNGMSDTSDSEEDSADEWSSKSSHCLWRFPNH